MEANLSFSDDLRLAFVVMKNEMLKQQRGKKLLIYGILFILILAAITGALLATDGLGDDAESLAYLYVAIISLMVIIGATLFGATTIVSEFEERTALIIFNRPIRKWSIFVGKFVAAYINTALFVVVYYLLVAVLCLIGPGSVDAALFVSLGYAMCYCFATVGVAMMISSFMKKASTASILTFFALALLFDLVLSIVSVAAGIEDPWYMINNAGNAIVNCLDSEYTVDGIRSVAVMLAWGLIPAVIGYLKFNNKDF